MLQVDYPELAIEEMHIWKWDEERYGYFCTECDRDRPFGYSPEKCPQRNKEQTK